MNTRDNAQMHANHACLDLTNPADLRLWLEERNGQDQLDVFEKIDAAIKRAVIGQPQPDQNGFFAGEERE